jgi:hypothetical protein
LPNTKQGGLRNGPYCSWLGSSHGHGAAICSQWPLLAKYAAQQRHGYCIDRDHAPTAERYCHCCSRRRRRSRRPASCLIRSPAEQPTLQAASSGAPPSNQRWLLGPSDGTSNQRPPPPLLSCARSGARVVRLRPHRQFQHLERAPPQCWQFTRNGTGAAQQTSQLCRCPYLPAPVRAYM